MESEKTQNWYHNLISECNNLAERFGLDDFHMEEMRQFVERVARDQFKSGRKSGYRYAKSGRDKKLTPMPEAVPA